MHISDEIIGIFERQGGAAYFGEPVSQLEHALQAAWHARKENAPNWLVVAALLHDIGHLLHDMPEHVADLGVDSQHESLGQTWLGRYLLNLFCTPVKAE